MTADRAMRAAVAAGEQVAENNPALAAVQRAAWTRFIRHVWGGPAVRPTDSTKPSEQSFTLQGEFGDVSLERRSIAHEAPARDVAITDG